MPNYTQGADHQRRGLPALTAERARAAGVLLVLLGWVGQIPADPGPFVVDRAAAGPAALAPSALPARTLGNVRSDHLRLLVDATRAFPSASLGLQCQGVSDNLARVPRISRRGDGPEDERALRFGSVGEATGGRVLRFVVDAADLLAPDTPPRCEVLGYPDPATALPQGVLFWFAVAIWVDDWGNTQDDQIVVQWHQNDPRLSLNPMLAVVVRGRTMRIELRHSSADRATRSSTQTETLIRTAMPVRRWTTLVFRARLEAPGTDRSTLAVWQDGAPLAEYSGDIGFQLAPGSFAYAKAGIYKWTNGNPWDLAAPRREVRIRRLLLAVDPLLKYSPVDLARAVAAD